MPETARKILDQLGVAEAARSLDARCYCADENATWNTTVTTALFPVWMWRRSWLLWKS